MLTLKATLRANRRYLLINGKRSAVEHAILEYIGILGWADAGPVFVSERGDEIILCVNREALRHIRGALALAKDELKVLRVSGTLKGLEK